MRRGLLLLVAFAALYGGSFAAGAIQADLEGLRGTWVLVSIRTGQGNQPQRERNVSFTFSKDRKVVLKQGDSGTEGTFMINSDKTPKEIDITTTKPGGAKEVLKAVYQVNGDNLKLAYSAKGADSERPTALDPKNAMVLTLTRQNP